MKVTIEISEQELKDLKRVRNYFDEHDKTMFEQVAYAIVDNVVKKLQQADVSGSLPLDGLPENILFKKRIRNGRKFFFGEYYNSLKLTLKEKLYILWFNMHKNHGLRQCELDFEHSIMGADIKTYNELETEFNKDYIEWQKSSSKNTHRA